ncbi:questin oxidase family protein [Paucibacter sp. AS339]|uniref:questin oxidase family protein n=1 Tax=Paucibacter hankyongi TaxID=3133434 RepID=UPI0030B74CDA
MLKTPDPILTQALDQALRYGPQYSGSTGLRLSTHLPMVLLALRRLGGDEQALQRQLNWAEKRLELRLLAEQPSLVPSDPLPEPPLGQDMPACRAYFAARLAQQSPLSVLRHDLPRLLAAPEATAFHGLIRLAYAWESGHKPELAEALAHWCSSFDPLGPPWVKPAEVDVAGAKSAPESLRETLLALRADTRLAMQPLKDTTIMTDMAIAHAMPGFAVYVGRPHLSLEALAEASLAVYLGSRAFTALHLVTGLHAARVLLQAVSFDETSEAGQTVLRALWRAWLAAYVSIGRPEPAWERVHQGQAEEAHWDRVIPALMSSPNEHDIKLADATREEWRYRGWPGYALCLRQDGAGA